MRTRTWPLFASALLAAGLLPAADSQLLDLVMPGARVLAGIHIERACASPLVGSVLEQMQANSGQVQQLLGTVGLDPCRVVREILVATTGDTAGKAGLALAAGDFQAVAAALALAGGKHADTYRDVRVYYDGPERQHALALLDTSILVAGDAASVKAALDRRDKPSVLPAALAAKVNRWRAAQDAWVVSAVPPSGLHFQGPGPAKGVTGSDAFRNVSQAALGVKITTSLDITAEATAGSAADAKALADVLGFLVNLLRSQAGQNPGTAAIAKSAKVSVSGQSVTLTISIPEEALQPPAGDRRRVIV